MFNKIGSSQAQIELQDVRDGVLYLSGNRIRSILETSAINLELKSEAEQDALIENYQSFLNSLNMPLQLIVRTREIDAVEYLRGVSLRLSAEDDDIYQTQLSAYREFVSGLISTNKILTRHFYVVVSVDADSSLKLEAIDQLQFQCDLILRGLGRMGLQARRLKTEEVLNIFYGYFSPDQSKRQPITAAVFASAGSTSV